MDSRRSRYVVAGLVGLLMVMGWYIRVTKLGDYYFSPDDIFHIYLSGGNSWGELIARVNADVHAPLLYFVVHVMLKISNNELWLRSVSLVPGLGLIPLMYILGKRMSGQAGGLFMAFMATFSKAAVVFSEVIRQYALANLFLAGAIVAVISFMEKPTKWKYVWYAAGGLLAVSAHYLFVVPIAWISVVVWWKTIKSGTGRWQVLLNIPTGVIIARAFLVQGRTVWPEWLVTSKGGWLEMSFPRSIAEYLNSAIHLAAYFTANNFLVVGVGVVLVAGIIAAVKQRKWWVWAIFGGCLGSSLVMTWLGKYPFGPSRQMMFLWLPFLMAAASGVEGGIKMVRWGSNKRQWKMVVGWFVFVIMCLAQLGYSEKTEYLRKGDEAEFPLTRQEWRQIQSFLNMYMTKDDVIMTNDFGMYYLAEAADLWGGDNLAARKEGSINSEYGRVVFWKNFGENLKMGNFKNLYTNQIINKGGNKGKIMIVTISGWVNEEVRGWSKSLGERGIKHEKMTTSGNEKSAVVYIAPEEFLKSIPI